MLNEDNENIEHPTTQSDVYSFSMLGVEVSAPVLSCGPPTRRASVAYKCFDFPLLDGYESPSLQAPQDSCDRGRGRGARPAAAPPNC